MTKYQFLLKKRRFSCYKKHYLPRRAVHEIPSSGDRSKTAERIIQLKAVILSRLSGSPKIGKKKADKRKEAKEN